MCRVLEVSRSGYYQWLTSGPSKYLLEEQYLKIEIKKIYEESIKSYGARRIRTELAKLNIRCSRRRVSKIMKKIDISPIRRRRFINTTESEHSLYIHPNILERNFYVNGPDSVWVSDITYIPTNQGWLYLSIVLDLFARKVVGWSMSNTMKATLTKNALEMAIANRNPSPGLIHHSDRGIQYACNEYQKVLNDNKIFCSMSRKGDCWDNAVAESFFSSLKKELVYKRRFKTMDQARMDIFHYIEIFYNRKRLHSSNGYVSPVEFETMHFNQQSVRFA